MEAPQTQPATAQGPVPALAEVHRRFIERWSQMAASWGVPRSMAEVHALLFVEARPVSAEELMQRLGISRGNASMTIRTLEEWGIVHRINQPADRRDYYVAEQDALALFATVMKVRKEREIDPLLSLVRECRTAAAAAGADGDERARQAALAFDRRLEDIDLFVRAIDAMAVRYLATDGSGLRTLADDAGVAR